MIVLWYGSSLSRIPLKRAKLTGILLFFIFIHQINYYFIFKLKQGFRQLTVVFNFIFF